MIEKIYSVVATLIFFGGLFGSFSPAFPQAMVIDHTCTELAQIPDNWIIRVKSDLHIVYQHTSHGSQLITGMNALENFPSFGTKYQWSDDGSAGLDLDNYGISDCADLSQGDYIDGNGVTPWVTATRNLLNNVVNYHINVVVWSWCSIDMHNTQRYVDNMEILISEYSEGGTAARAELYPVKFVFMTGHAQGQGKNLYTDPDANGDGHVHYNNQLIRQHCSTSNRILFDFADIEAYDPDGNYYWDLNMTDALYYTGGNWGEEWIDGNLGSELELLTAGSSSCAHCDGPDNKARINCILKGRASWWMWARLSGWNGQTGAPTPTPSIIITPTPTPTSTPEVTPICSPCMIEAWGSVYNGRTLTPIENSYVELAGSDWKYDWFGNDWTDQSGNYNIQGGACCGGGEGTIQASAWGYQTMIRDITYCCVNDFNFFLNPLITATPTCSPTPSPAPTVSIEVSGAVIDAWTNQAVEGARVYLRTEYRYHHTTTTATGSFEFLTGGPTRATLSISSPGYHVSTVKTFLNLGSNEITLYLTPSAGQTGGDYDGDGTEDLAVFRKKSGLWAVRTVTRLYFGALGDLPVAGDYDGNGTTDPSIFRENGLWAIRGITRLYFGTSDGLPVVSDYNGDGTTDLAVFFKGSGLWAVRTVTRLYFGALGDIPVGGDYDGDGTAETGIYRPTVGLWAARTVTRAYYGGPDDLPIPANWSGSGIIVPAVFRPDIGLWATLGMSRSYFGTGGDEPVPTDFDGDGTTGIAVFRGSSGLWALQGVSRLYFGTEYDIPVMR